MYYMHIIGSSWSQFREVLEFEKCWTASFSSSSHRFHNYSLPSVPTLSHRPSPSPHTFYSYLPHKMLLSVIFKPSFSLLLISFPLFILPSASCWIFFCNFTGFLAIYKVVTSTFKKQCQAGVSAVLILLNVN